MTTAYTLDDFRKQLAILANGRLIQWARESVTRPSPLADVLDHEEFAPPPAVLGIIDAMTPAERSDARLIDATRRRRIASGAGCEPERVGELIKQYTAMADVMTTMADKGLRDRMRGRGDLRLKSREVPFDTPDDHNPPPEGTVPPLPA